MLYILADREDADRLDPLIDIFKSFDGAEEYQKLIGYGKVEQHESLVDFYGFEIVPVAIHSTPGQDAPVIGVIRSIDFGVKIAEQIAAAGCWGAYRGKNGLVNLVIEGGDDAIETGVRV